MIQGAGNQSAVGTLVERNARLLILVKLAHPHPATAAHVLHTFTDKLNAIAQLLRKTLTYDLGKEMAYRQQLSANTGLRCISAIRTAHGSEVPIKTPMA